MPPMIYKVLGAGGTCIHGIGSWSLPHDGQPGEWMPYIKVLYPCESGYHVCESVDSLLEWLGQEIYEVEVRGERVEKSSGVGVYHEARLLRRVETWNDRTARLFACDCVERVAHLDPTGTAATTITIARRYANGDATAAEFNAAWSAAGGAAWSAAWSAAEADERAWQVERLKWYLDGGDDDRARPE